MPASVVSVAARRENAAGLTAVAAGSVIANLAGYLLHVPAIRWLGVRAYGELASLLAIQLLLAVPALGWQTVIARDTVRGATVADLAGVRRRCLTAWVVLAIVGIPVAAGALQVGPLATAAALAAAPGYFVLGEAQGLLQARERFRALGVVLAVAGAGRVAPAMAVLAAGCGPAAVCTAASLGVCASAWYARRVAARTGFPAGHGTGVKLGVRQLLFACQVPLLLVVLSSADVLAARVWLDHADAGRYALGAVAAKAAFWLPQSVVLVAFPRMTRAARAVPATLALLAALGAVATAATAAAAPLAPTLAGAGYAAISARLWLFALVGALLAVLQGTLLAAVATRLPGPIVTAWLGVGIWLTALAGWAHTLDRLLLTTAAAVAAVTVAAAGQLLVQTVGSTLVSASSPGK